MATAIEVIASHYGYEEQSRMCQEEAAELIQAINKVHRKHIEAQHDIAQYYSFARSLDELYEEMADVKIMLEQIEVLLQCSPQVKMAYEFKLQRQLERIRKEGK